MEKKDFDVGDELRVGWFIDERNIIKLKVLSVRDGDLGSFILSVADIKGEKRVYNVHCRKNNLEVDSEDGYCRIKLLGIKKRSDKCKE